MRALPTQRKHDAYANVSVPVGHNNANEVFVLERRSQRPHDDKWNDRRAVEVKNATCTVRDGLMALLYLALNPLEVLVEKGNEVSQPCLTITSHGWSTP